MQIKQALLSQQVNKGLLPLYVLVGQDHYFINESFNTLKKALQNKQEYEEKRIFIENTDDWQAILDESSAYSLFSECTLLNVLIEKKTLDAAGKKILTTYLEQSDAHTVLILRAANIPAKQFSWLQTHPKALVCLAYPLNQQAMKQWIGEQLKQKNLQFDASIPSLIEQYTQGNMLACAQAIEKISLVHTTPSHIQAQEMLEQLFDQSTYNLFELIDAYLLGQSEKIISILKQAANNKTEATLVLWVLSQEIRVLIQLESLLRIKDLNSAGNSLKIWPQKHTLYQKACQQKRSILKPLHQYCLFLDECIKSNAHYPIWNGLENLALSLCLGQLVGDACAL